MKNLLKILFFLVFFIQTAFSQDVKFIFLSDIDINTKNKQSVIDFEDTIKEINSYNDIDFVVLGGNNISKAGIENLNKFTSLLRKINKKTYVLLGSSDVLSTSGIDKKYYLKKIRMALLFAHSSKPNYTFKIKNVRFVTMDGSKQYFQSTNGYYDKNELLWLDKTLTKYKDDNIIILQHFPIIPTKSEWKMTAKIENYLEVLKKHKNVKAIVSGHYNSNLECDMFNIRHILVENFNGTKAYKIIEINFDDDFIGTYLVR